MMTREEKLNFMSKISELTDEQAQILLAEMVKNPNYTECDEDTTINPASIIYMGLEANDNDEPCLTILHNENDEDNSFEKESFSLTEGWQIYIVNEFLRSLDLGVYVSFESYQQYSQLITECWNRLQKQRASQQYIKN